ncbi:gag-pol fusion [Pelobates cultripes]|uniref:Gypsy retrotransposon integrase-like protein 1 n=1 Tax=Pelobates cultripes TaxID=61616 RepID=A0AAD1VIZ1_PELCU|nr:gag-pol fusion [Pelobates cultripes]
METKYNDIVQFLCFGEYPPGYSKTQRQTFRQTSAKFTLKEGEVFVGRRRVIKNEEEARRIFVEFHASPIGGHTGTNTTRSAISSRFFWHGMASDIDKWVQECDNCQKSGKPLSAPQLLQCIKVSAVWELVGIDLTGPFTETVDGFKYILTATDYFSKWVEAFPLKSKCAGCPKRILSDQGRELINQLNDQMCSLLGIERSVTAAYHPQTNGLDEKTNHNIKRQV